MVFGIIVLTVEEMAQGHRKAVTGQITKLEDRWEK
tara:strand:- start:307 stop:411 length:105 start_codon:yes stop_codon:yes gene_type:complete